jgi:hypothetical protein
MALLMKYIAQIYFHLNWIGTSTCILFIPTLKIYRNARTLPTIDERGIFNIRRAQLLTFHESVF